MKQKSESETIRLLRAQIKELERSVEALSVDPAYGVTTRPAVELELRAVEKRARFVVFLDIDHLHDLNEKTPGKHEAVNKKIRRALHVRSEDVLIRARWYSGDELIFIIAGEPRSFLLRLTEAFALEGMSFTAHHSPYTGKLEEDAARAKKVVDRLKAARGVGR